MLLAGGCVGCRRDTYRFVLIAIVVALFPVYRFFMATLSKRSVKTKTGAESKSRSRVKMVRKVASSPRRSRVVAGGRVLVSGQSREALRTLGVVLAAEVDRDLYCVDLSRVVGKYIGETEKNLARVFAMAAATDAVLFFDEADALFGKRTEVKDSHDRYANQEVSYLVERLEAHPGLIVLATNARKNLDEAFLRRLRFTSAVASPVKRKST